MDLLRTLCAFGALASAFAGQTQTGDTPAPVATTPTPAICCSVANGTPVEIELVDALSSKVQKRGDTFHIKLSTALVVDGKVLLPADVEGMGQIIDAAPAGGGGAPGKMLVAARYLEWNGTKIPLRGTKLGGAGKNNTLVAAGLAPVIGLFSMFVHGGNVIFPPGTHFEAKLAADTTLAPQPGNTGVSGAPDAPAAAAAHGTAAAVATPAMPENAAPAHAETATHSSATTPDHSQAIPRSKP